MMKSVTEKFVFLGFTINRFPLIFRPKTPLITAKAMHRQRDVREVIEMSLE